MKVLGYLILILSLIVFSSGCTVEVSDGCYSSELEDNHSGICTQDCPGVCGCNGATYCNECEANRSGIMEVISGPCD